MLDFLLGTHEFLGNHSFPEFIVGYLFGAALIIGAPTVFLLLAFVSALMKTNGKMGGYREYETYGESSLNDAPPFLLPDPTNPKLSKQFLATNNQNYAFYKKINVYLFQTIK